MMPIDSSRLRPWGRVAGGSVLALLGSSGLLMSKPACAELSPALDRVSMSLGAFRADPQFNVVANTRFGRIDTGDFERSTVTMPRIKVDLLLSNSQGLSFDYYRFRRNYAGALARDFTVNTTTVDASAAANLNVQLDFAKLAYKWWLGSGNTVFGLGVGAAYYRAALDSNATATINSLSGSFNGNFTESATAPLLEIGLRHAINPNLRLFADASGIRKNGGALHGNIYNAALGVEWFPVKNIGLVLDYGISHIVLTRDANSNAELRVKLNGPSAFVKVRF